MQFLRRHFEKIILSAVLAGLGVAAVWLAVAVNRVAIDLRKGLAPPAKAKPWVAVDLEPFQTALKGVTNPPDLNLTGDHNLFNPKTWKKLSDGSLVKITTSGAEALAVSDIRPLFFSITLESQAGDGYYLIAKHALGMPLRYFALIGDKPSARKPYPIVGTNSAGDPPVLILQVQIPDADETVPVSTNAPYKEVEGYEVDLRYSASDMTNEFTRKHLDDTLQLSEDSYKIIAIGSNGVTVQNTKTSQKTEKQWSAPATNSAATNLPGGASPAAEQQRSAGGKP